MSDSYPLYSFWLGPVMTRHQCEMCYRRYREFRHEYNVRAAAYSHIAPFDDLTATYLLAYAASEILGRPLPESLWDLTIPAYEDAEPGDWWDYEQGVPQLDSYGSPLPLLRFVISGAVCAIMAQVLVASMIVDAYNLGTGGPGGLVGEERR